MPRGIPVSIKILQGDKNMTLLLIAAIEVSDLVIDFIEARLPTGKTISLNWDRSWTERSKGHFVALYD